MAPAPLAAPVLPQHELLRTQEIQAEIDIWHTALREIQRQLVQTRQLNAELADGNRNLRELHEVLLSERAV